MTHVHWKQPQSEVFDFEKDFLSFNFDFLAKRSFLPLVLFIFFFDRTLAIILLPFEARSLIYIILDPYVIPRANFHEVPFHH
jgi:hypothetical protein